MSFNFKQQLLINKLPLDIELIEIIKSYCYINLIEKHKNIMKLIVLDFKHAFSRQNNPLIPRNMLIYFPEVRHADTYNIGPLIFSWRIKKYDDLEYYAMICLTCGEYIFANMYYSKSLLSQRHMIFQTIQKMIAPNAKCICSRNYRFFPNI